MADAPSPRFLDGPITLALDAVRAAAALMVVAGHLHQLKLYQGPWPFADTFQHVAVVVFFVLSGLVIANAALARPVGWRDYAIARATRIVPVAALAVALGVGSALLVGAFGTHPVEQPDFVRALDWRSVALPLALLSEGWRGSGPAWNAPYWSLCYEAWYYALFGAALYLRGRRRTICLTVLALIAGPRIILLLPVWLAGVALARSRRTFDLTPAAGAVCLAFSVAMIGALAGLAIPVMKALFWVTGLKLPEFRSSQFFLTDWLSTPFVVLGFVGLKPLAERFVAQLERCRRPIEAAAGSSFTLYALHWPVMSLLAGFGLATTSLPGWLGLIAGFQLGAIAVSRVTEAQRYALRAMLKRRLASSDEPKLDSYPTPNPFVLSLSKHRP